MSGTQLTTVNHINAKAEFIFELSAGIDEPNKIAERYGYSEEQWARLRADPAFIKAVDIRKSELKSMGYVPKAKAALAAEDLMDDIYLGAKKEETPLNQKIEAFKILAKIGGLEPKEVGGVTSGTGFTININMGDKSITLGTKPAEQVIEAEVLENK